MNENSTQVASGHASLTNPNFVSLRPEAQRAFTVAHEVTDRLAQASPLQVVDTFQGITRLMKPVVKGAPEIPQDATAGIAPSGEFAITGLGDIKIGVRKIETVHLSGGVVLKEASGQETRLVLYEDVADKINISIMVNGPQGEKSVFVRDITTPPPTQEKQEVIHMLKGLCPYFMEGMCTAASLTQETGRLLPDAPEEEKQAQYAKALEAGFGEIRNKLPTVVIQKPKAEAVLTGIETLPGYTEPFSAAVLTNMEVQLRSLGQGAIFDRFRSFIEQNNLQGTLSGLWGELQNLRGNIYDPSTYANSQFGEKAWGTIFQKEVEILGFANAREMANDPAAREKLKIWRNETAAVFNAVKGILKTVFVARNADLQQLSLSELADRIHGKSDLGDLAKIVSGQGNEPEPNWGIIERTRGELFIKLIQIGSYFPPTSDYDNVRKKIS